MTPKPIPTASPNVAAWFEAHGIDPNKVSNWKAEATTGSAPIVRWDGVMKVSEDDLMELAAAADRDAKERYRL